MQSSYSILIAIGGLLRRNSSLVGRVQKHDELLDERRRILRSTMGYQDHAMVGMGAQKAMRCNARAWYFRHHRGGRPEKVFSGRNIASLSRTIKLRSCSAGAVLYIVALVNATCRL